MLYHNARKLCKCDGQATYQAERVDAVVTELMRNLFQGLKGAPEEERLKQLYKNKADGDRAQLKKLENQLTKDKKQMETLKLEIAKCLTGDSAFSQEDLIDAMNVLRNRMDEAENQMEKIREDESSEEAAMAKIFPVYQQFKSWAEEFETATMEQKKMIACQLFKRIEVGRDYSAVKESQITGLYKTFGVYGRVKAYFSLFCPMGLVMAVVVFFLKGLSIGEKIGMFFLYLALAAFGAFFLWSAYRKCPDFLKKKCIPSMLISGFGVAFKIAIFFLGFVWKLVGPQEMQDENGNTVYVCGDYVYDEFGQKIGVASADKRSFVRTE